MADFDTAGENAGMAARACVIGTDAAFSIADASGTGYVTVGIDYGLGDSFGSTMLAMSDGARFHPIEICYDGVDRFDPSPMLSMRDKRRAVHAPLQPRADAVTHIDTPKPVSKRRARRLRGKGRA